MSKKKAGTAALDLKHIYNHHSLGEPMYDHTWFVISLG